MKTIYWLASYPKSGNTWTRLFLANYRSIEEKSVGINDIGGSIVTSRELFEEYVGVDSSELTPSEIERCRPAVYRALAAEQKDPIFLKVHDACTYTGTGELLFPPDVTAGVIYLIRNPMDVAVSYAHHRDQPIAQVVRLMCDDNYIVSDGGDHLSRQLPQRLLSWSGHVRSWVDDSGLRMHVARFEDLVAQPAESFRQMLQFAGLPFEPLKLERALESTRFENLQAQEEMDGFSERTAKSTRPFFGKGKSGGWRMEMNLQLARQLIDVHREIMHRYGYLTGKDEPTF